MTGIQKDFYANLGLLSANFAQLEQNIISILCLLTTFDSQSVLGILLFENNSLSKNLDVLEKIIRLRSFKRCRIESFIKEIKKLKNDRNLFIHGIWGNPFTNSSGDIAITCEYRKIKYQQDSAVSIQQWKLKKIEEFTLADIKIRISKLKDLIESQDIYIEELEDHLLNQGVGDFYWD